MKEKKTSSTHPIKKSFIREFLPFIKYSVVGTSGTIVDVASLFVFIEYFALPLLLATTISFMLSVVNNFVLNKIWTFKNTSSNYRKLFIKFLIVSCGGLCITNVAMYIQVEWMDVWYIYAKLITSVIVLSWNFLANKYWTFHIKPKVSVVESTSDLDYSVIIPAYNEEHRLPETIKKISTYFVAQKLKVELIVVDDGSSDATVTKCQELAKDIDRLRVIEIKPNRGKGFAVKQGVLNAKSHHILFSDADLSTPIEEIESLRLEMDANKADIAIGSRYLTGSRVKIRQSKFRVAIGRIGNLLIRSFVMEGIKDSQCGFKLFTAKAAKDIFSCNKIERWGFDMEVLAIAKLKDYQIVEVPVSWFNSPDSRLRPVRDAINTFVELIKIKLNVWCGRYEDA